MEDRGERQEGLPDDFSRKLEQFLNDPASMNKLQSALSAFGLEETAAPAPLPESPLETSMPDLSLMAKLAPLMSGMGKDDRNTVLLKALRPYLSGEREKRLEDAIRMMRLLNLLPLLNEK
jgi:hypothetical protein